MRECCIFTQHCKGTFYTGAVHGTRFVECLSSMTRLGDGRDAKGPTFAVRRSDGGRRTRTTTVGVNFTQITSIRYTASERADGKERRQVDGGSLGRSPSAVAATTTTYHHPLYWGVVNIANSRQRRTQKQEARGWSMESSYRVGLILQGLEHSFSKGVPFAPFIN